MGDCEAETPVSVESPFGYHPSNTGILTAHRDPVAGQYQVDSLTGAVASEKVTEALKGFLRLVGNQPTRVQMQKEA